MYCRDCTGKQSLPCAEGLSRDICAYTGVAITTLILSGVSDDADNGAAHDCDRSHMFCPRNLAPLLASPEGRTMIRGVLRQVQERGELDALLASYELATADKLMTILMMAKVAV